MDRRPWTYPKWAEDSMRDSFHLRSELFPYIYTSAAQSGRDTVPLDRPLYFDYPARGAGLPQRPGVPVRRQPARRAHRHARRRAGPRRASDRLVPAGRRGTTTSPASSYVGRHGRPGLRRHQRVPAVRPGRRPRPDAALHAAHGDRAADDAARPLLPRRGRADGPFTLYEDDGVTTAYERGQSATTPLSYTRKGNTVTVTVGATRRAITPGSLPSARSSSNCRTRRAPPAPRWTASLLAAAYDAVNFINRITLPPGPSARPTVVVVQAAPAGDAVLAARAQARRLAGVMGPAAAGKTARQILAAQGPTLPPDTQEALLALAGVGLVTRNDGPYAWGGPTRARFLCARPCGRRWDTHRAHRRPAGRLCPFRRTRSRPCIGAAKSVAFRIAGQEFRLPDSPLLDEDNVAMTAKVSANGSEGGYSPAGAIDGVAGGYPGDKAQEWSSGKRTGGVLRLDWNAPQTIDRILLYDRPNLDDQVTSGLLTFSDGSTLAVGDLPDDAKTPREVRFPAKTITWLSFTITGVKPTTQNGGLSEIAVFRAKQTQ